MCLRLLTFFFFGFLTLEKTEYYAVEIFNLIFGAVIGQTMCAVLKDLWSLAGISNLHSIDRFTVHCVSNVAFA